MSMDVKGLRWFERQVCPFIGATVHNGQHKSQAHAGSCGPPGSIVDGPAPSSDADDVSSERVSQISTVLGVTLTLASSASTLGGLPLPPKTPMSGCRVDKQGGGSDQLFFLLLHPPTTALEMPGDGLL